MATVAGRISATNVEVARRSVLQAETDTGGSRDLAPPCSGCSVLNRRVCLCVSVYSCVQVPSDSNSLASPGS